MSFEPIQVGKFKRVRPLAEGGMAELFRARPSGRACGGDHGLFGTICAP